MVQSELALSLRGKYKGPMHRTLDQHFLSLETNMKFFSNSALICVALYYLNMTSAMPMNVGEADDQFAFNLYNCGCALMNDDAPASPVKGPLDAHASPFKSPSMKPNPSQAFGKTCYKDIRINADGSIVDANAPRISRIDRSIIGKPITPFVSKSRKTVIRFNEKVEVRFRDNTVTWCKLTDPRKPVRYAIQTQRSVGPAT